MEGVDKMLKQRDFYMNKDYKKVPDLKCFNEKPALLPCNINSLVGKKWKKAKKKAAKEIQRRGGRKTEKTTK